MLTIGYIGNGKSANRYHVPYVLTRPNIIIKTMFPASDTAWDRIEGVHYTDDMDELLCDEDIQLVVICTPPATHYDLAVKALNAGKNVLVEKPFTPTYRQAAELFELAERKGLVVQTYQNRRYDSDYLTVKKVIESGELGELYEFVMTFDYWRPDTVLNSKRAAYYDTLYYGHTAHTLDQVIALFGEPDSISYDVRNLCGPDKMNDYYDLDLRYGNLKVSIQSSYFRTHRRPAFCVYGKRGAFIKETPDRQEEDLKRFYLPMGHDDFGVDAPEQYGKLYTRDSDGNECARVVPSERGDYGRVYDDLYEVIVNGAPKVIADDQTLLLMKLMEEGAKSCGMV